MKKIQLSEIAHDGRTKVDRYGWATDLGPRGVAIDLYKTQLHIPTEYQRDPTEEKVKVITAGFNWPGFGCLVVVRRDGRYLIVDGQHRWLATLRRADIDTVPCMVFEFDSLTDEAKAFLTLNTARKPMTAVGKQKALAVAGDPVAALVKETIDGLGLVACATASRKGQIKCIACCMRLATVDPDRFKEALSLAEQLCSADDIFIAERVLDGLFYLGRTVDGGLANTRLVKRLRQIGAHALLDAANRFARAYDCGGAKVWATGMLEAANKGLQNKFEMTTYKD